MTGSRQELIEKLRAYSYLGSSSETALSRQRLTRGEIERIIADLRFAEFAHQQLERAEPSADVQLQAQNAAHGCTKDA